MMMEKRINNTAISTLMAATKSWDFAILYVRGRNPVVVEKDMEIQWEVTDFSVTLRTTVGHPAPQSQADVQRRFNLFSYLEVSEIVGADFFKEKIIQGPGASNMTISR